MTDVTWLAHPLYADYEASSDGRVRSVDRAITYADGGVRIHRGRELKPYLDQNGYLMVTVRVNCKPVHTSVHRVVCATFHGLPKTSDLQVRHLNGVSTDNHPENLAWGTCLENMQDMRIHGTNHWASQTHCASGHEFNEANTYIRKDRVRPQRLCRVCDRTRQQQYRNDAKEHR